MNPLFCFFGTLPQQNQAPDAEKQEERQLNQGLCQLLEQTLTAIPQRALSPL